MRRSWWTFFVLLALASACHPPAPVITHPNPALSALSPDATWPWKNANDSSPQEGVRHWFAAGTDGSSLELFEFDFLKNPRLEFGMFDQDEDDEKPRDNLAAYLQRGVGAVAKHLNQAREGRVVAAWNGSFFAYAEDRQKATHVGPVIQNGKLFYYVGNPRWTFGIDQKGKFQVLHEPDRHRSEQTFQTAVAGVQCLVKEGRPLRIEPYPLPGERTQPQPVPSTDRDAGHIPLVDHMRTSRTSMAWSRESARLYLLIVNEPDNELGSKLAVKHGEVSIGGWQLADLQAFWMKKGVWGAVNVDGGAVTQMTFLRGDGKYELLPPRLVSPNKRLVFDDSFTGAPGGGTLMTFFVRSK